MVLTKLFILGQERELLYADTSYSRDTRINGKSSTQIMGGLISVCFASQMNDDLILRWMTKKSEDVTRREIDKMEEGKICFYDNGFDYPPTKTWIFNDSHLINYKEIFNAEGKEPMKIILTISPAIQDYGTLFLKRWNVSYIPPSEKTPYQAAQEEEKTDLKFIAKFERLSTYKGEFGFDWMRDNYKDICENYEKLKKEYFTTLIHEEEYFVPTISMFPNQKGVKLKLSINKKEGTVDHDDVIKLPAKGGIRFEPDEIKVSEAGSKQITIICESPLSSDVLINLLDKDDKTVGKLNVFKNANHEQLHFNITPVRVLRSASKQTDIDTIDAQIDIKGTVTNKDGTTKTVKGWGDTGQALAADLKNLENYLNKNSLNQALLQCNIGKVYDIIIDEDKWIADDLIIDEGCVFKGSLLDKFSKEFEKQHPIAYKNRGITTFMSPLANVGSDGTGGAGGYGNLADIDSKNLAIFKTNLWVKNSFAHEIAHVAGLEHSFKEEDDAYNNQSTLDNHNTYIKEVDDYINYMLKNNYPTEEIAEFWSDRKKDYKTIRSLLNVYYRNLHKFEQGKTENFMDYYNDRKSFWKFQWKALQDDILKFYSSK